MKYEVIRGQNDFLTKRVEDFDFTNPPLDPLDLAQDLLKTMYSHRALGLAANQCGLSYRCFVMIGPKEDFAFFNPRIAFFSDEKEEHDEGCLSYPNLIIPIWRSKQIRVRFQVPSGEMMSKTFEGMSARVIAHETSHLNGEVFFQGVSRMKLQKAIKDTKKKYVTDYNGKGFLKFCS